jgi:hypothetical protein
MGKIMRFLFILLIFLFANQSLRGQVVLEGQVKGLQGEPLSNINILIYPMGSDVLIAFAISDERGNWRTTVNSASDSLDVETSSVQYSKDRRRIANRNQIVLFHLVIDVKELNTFILKAKEIEQRGDTISYLVSSFAQQQNRTISDVLKNMPGIEVEPSGKILYQGIPINRFYVEGLDLMSGSYGIISNNMPHQSVATVEILENHQPIRLLEDHITSHQAALNLKLKKDITTTGTSSLGMGGGPILWDANLTPMTFTRKIQAVNSYQTNNIGKDVAHQLVSFTPQDFRNKVDRPIDKPQMLSIQSVLQPEFRENRYLDNNIHLLNSNALITLNKDLQLRANLYFVNDSKIQKGVSNIDLYSPADTISYTESIDNRFFDNYFHGQFTLNRNVRENYMNNKLKFETHGDHQRGLITQNEENVYQSLRIPFQKVSNETNSIWKMGRQLIEFSSYIAYDYSRQQLLIKPGGFENEISQGEQNEGLQQKLYLRRFFSDQSAGFTFRGKNFTFSPRAGFLYRSQLLESDLEIRQENEWLKTPAFFSNSLDGDLLKGYLNNEIQYRKKHITLTATLPLSWQQMQLHDHLLDHGQQKSRLLFNPRLSADYHISGFWRIRGSWSYTSHPGDLEGKHYGFILKNHRNLRQDAAPLSEMKTQNLTVFLSFRNPIIAFFNSLSYNFSRSDFNLIYSNKVQSDGTTVIHALNQPNTGYSHMLMGRTSKFFSKTKSTISLRASYLQTQRNSLLNEQSFVSSNQLFDITPQVNTRILKWLSSEYRANMGYIYSYAGEKKTSSISMFRHYLDIHATPGRIYYNYRGNENIFVDLFYRYTFRKQRIDLDARWLNIFNTGTYTSFHPNAYSVLETTYMLRPSQVMLTMKFSF